MNFRRRLPEIRGLLRCARGPRNSMKKGGAGAFACQPFIRARAVGRRKRLPHQLRQATACGTGLSPLLRWACGPRNPMKNRGAANPGCGPAFERVQPAESRLQARLPAPHRWHRGHAGGFSTLLRWAFRPRNFMKNRPRAHCPRFSEPGARGGFSPLLGWAFRPRNPMKNRGAANPGCGPAFERVQPAESRLQARLPAPHRWHRGHAGGFSTLSQGCPAG
jgi:hypothetical protein